MSGYRCVNFYDLCRLCTASQGGKVNVFGDEGRAKGLQGKIVRSLNISVDEHDKLPKSICTSCCVQIEQIAEYKENCDQAQALLASCINSTKLRNGGQVYIKDEAPKKPVVEPPAVQMTPTFTITATPKMAPQPQTVTTQNVSSDFLSSIIQAVGIQAQEEIPEQQVQQQQQPQYTLTIDGQTIKASPIQYKLTETTPTYIQPQQISDDNSMTNNLLNEFIKMKEKKNSNQQPQQMTIDLTPAFKKVKADAGKGKSQKINFVLSSPPKQQGQQQQQQQQILTIPQQTSSQQTQQNKVSLQQMLQPNKAMIPIIIKSDGSVETSNQLFQQIAAVQQQQQQQATQQAQQFQQNQQPVAYVQLKIQPNADGQPTVQLTPTVTPQLQLSQSSFQGLNLQQQIQQQIQQQVAQLTAAAANQQQQQNTPQTIQFQQQTQMPQISISAPQQAHIIPQQPQLQVSVDTQVSQADIADMDDNMDHSGIDDSEPEAPPPPPPQPKQQQKQIKVQNSNQTPQIKIKTEPQIHSSDNSVPATADSIMASLQMQLITSLKHEGPDPPTNLTTCDVCKKVFKRKEHLMQHLKSHIGLRPFKCDEVGCNKAFSRKEHLMRHVVSHTGKKMFSCELCHKFFSRKDNLNKHRRTHPEVAGDSAPFSCEFCDKKFTIKTSYNQHKLTHEQGEQAATESQSETTEMVVKIKKDQNVILNKKPAKIKQENENLPQEQQQVTTITIPQSLNSQQQIKLQTSDHQQQQQQLTQPIQIQMSSQQSMQPQILQLPLQSIVSSSAAQNQITYNQTTTQSTKTTYFKAVSSGSDGTQTVYTIPSNLILQNPAFMTATGELQVGGFKIENN